MVGEEGEGRRDSWECGEGLVVLQEGENPADAGQGHFRFPLPEERRDRRKRLGRRTRTVAGRRFTLAGKDDLGEREEEAEYCFKDFHKLEGFFNF